jgi:sporulation protein YlmC with PRC-barrel domain
MAPPSRDLNLGRMKGKTVIDSNGDDVGTVEDAVVEPGTWKISGFLVALRRDLAQDLNLGRRGFLDQGPRVEITSDRIRTVGDHVLLNIDRVAFADALRQPPPEADLPPREPYAPAPSILPGETGPSNLGPDRPF